MNSEKKTMNRILVRGVNWLGDAVMSMPAVSNLRAAFPNSTIALLTHKKLIDIWMNNPDLNEIILLDENLFSVAKKIRHRKFDLAIAFPNSYRSAIELWFGGIEERIGFRGFLRSFFLTKSVTQPHKFVKIKKLDPRHIKSIIEGKSKHPYSLAYEFHHIYNYLALVAAVGAKESLAEPKIQIRWNELMDVIEKFKFKNKILIAINPGAEYGAAKVG
jgi:heptosyltransferase-2